MNIKSSATKLEPVYGLSNVIKIKDIQQKENSIILSAHSRVSVCIFHSDLYIIIVYKNDVAASLCNHQRLIVELERNYIGSNITGE